MEAKKLHEIDEDYKAHRQAFLNFQVQATDKKGRPIYKHFEKFFDYDKVLAGTKKKPQTDRFAALKQHLREDEHNG